MTLTTAPTPHPLAQLRGWAAVTVLTWGLLPAAQAARPVLCVFDLLGKSGDVHAMAVDYAVAMGQAGLELELRSYMDERIAADDFRAGQCIGAVLTGFRARAFNAVSGSLDSLGSTTVVRQGRVDMAASYDVLRRMIQAFASPQAAPLMREGLYEIGGIFPLGAAYPMVRDRNLTSVEALANQRVGVFDTDKAQALLAQKLGAQPMAVEVTNVGPKFNNGLLDVIHLPALTYKPLELYKGMGIRGGVVRVPVMIPTVQVVFNRASLPEGVGQRSREFWAEQFNRAMKLIGQAEAGIPPATWIDMPPASIGPYVEVLREGRRAGAEQGLYAKRTLNLMKKARCQLAPEEAECASGAEVP